MNSVLLAISTMLWVNFHILISWLPTPVEEIPIIQYSVGPANTDMSRFAKVQWLNAYELFSDINTDDPDPKYYPNVAQTLDQYAAAIKAQPKGRHTIFPWHLESSPYINTYNTLILHHDNGCKKSDGSYVMWSDWWGRERTLTCPWFEGGVPGTYKKFKYIFSELKKRGVTIDYFSTENEVGFVSWTMVAGQADAIQNDPRFPELEAELGFHNFADAMDRWWATAENRAHMIKANNVLMNRVYKAFYNSMYKALREEFPSARVSDYAKYYTSSNFRTFDLNGWQEWNELPPIAELFTNGSDLQYLGCAQQCANDNVPEMSPFPNTLWNTFLKSLNEARAIRLSNPVGKGFWPYLAPKSFEGNHPYYSEHLMHLALTFNVFDGYVFWNPDPDTTRADFDTITAAMKEIDPKLGYADRKVLTDKLIGWHDTAIESCAMANKKKICRHTEPTKAWWIIDGVKGAETIISIPAPAMALRSLQAMESTHDRLVRLMDAKRP